MNLNLIKQKTILLIGDPILDIYVYGTALGKSLETPTIVAKKLKTQITFGGATLVVRNILELGSFVKYIAVLGSDKNSKYYDNLKHKNLDKYLILDKSRKTTTKKRFWIDGYKLLQIDELDNRDVNEDLENKIIKIFKDEIKKCDIIVISDYRHGLLTKKLISTVIEIATKNQKKILVDSQISHREGNHHLYKGSSMILLSENEAKTIDPNFKIVTNGISKKIQNYFKESNICIKLGKQGSIYSDKSEIIRSPAIEVNSVDTCGAGDAFLAACAVSDLKEISNVMEFANIWAGLSTTIHGTLPPTIKKFENYIKNKNK